MHSGRLGPLRALRKEGPFCLAWNTPLDGVWLSIAQDAVPAVRV